MSCLNAIGEAILEVSEKAANAGKNQEILHEKFPKISYFLSCSARIPHEPACLTRRFSRSAKQNKHKRLVKDVVPVTMCLRHNGETFISRRCSIPIMSSAALIPQHLPYEDKGDRKCQINNLGLKSTRAQLIGQEYFFKKLASMHTTNHDLTASWCGFDFFSDIIFFPKTLLEFYNLSL